MSERIRKLIIRVAVCLAVISLMAGYVYGDVYFTEETGITHEAVYIAGNSECYPFEYYDENTETYLGMIPEMMKKVSENTGIDFVYIKSGEYEQADLAKNSQAELISSIEADDDAFSYVSDSIEVFTINDSRNPVHIYMGFTEITPDDVKDKITEGFSLITPQEKMEMISRYAIDDNSSVEIIYIVFGAALLVVLMIIITVLIVKRDRKKYAEKNSKVDFMTGIGNRDYYNDSFRNSIKAEVRSLYSLALFGFEEESFRKMHGDRESRGVQQKIAGILAEELKQGDYLARVENGKFALLYYTKEGDDIEIYVEKLLSHINDSLYDINPYYLGAVRAGICRISENLTYNSDMVLYNAEQGYSYAVINNLKYAVGTEKLVAENKRQERLRGRFTEAIRNGEFRLYVQFIVECTTGKIMGCEALSRWREPETGLLTPGRYIEMMIQNGVVADHDFYMFEQVCRQLEAWKETRYSNLYVSCNFTRITISEEGFIYRLKEIVDRYTFDLNHIIIEISEDSIAMDHQQSKDNINMCKAMGFRIAIDDMGCGNSSLYDLYDYPIDYVKIDKKIIQEAVTHRGAKLLQAIVNLGHEMDALVLCEGVETEAQNQAVLNTKCDYIQGYYYSRVLSPGEYERFLENNY